MHNFFDLYVKKCKCMHLGLFLLIFIPIHILYYSIISLTLSFYDCNDSYFF